MGKLNILHHKSYHVYNRENVERVRRDELQAELEAEEKNQSTIAANSEARLSLLRSQKQQLKKESSKGKERRIEKALEDQLKGKLPKSTEHEASNGDTQAHSDYFTNNKTTDNSSIVDPTNGHINFWSSLENQSTSKVFGSKSGLEKNTAYMNDLKKKDEKWDELITMRLDKPAHELRPWYAQNDLINGEDKKLSERKIKARVSKDESFKTANDPLTFVKRSLYPSTSHDQINLKKRKERHASRSPSPVVQHSPSDKEELDDMPALPPARRIVQKPNLSPKLKSSSLPAPRVLKIDESAEKLKAQALLRRHHAPTPRSEMDASPYGYTDLYNRNEIEAIQFESRRYRHHHNNHSSSSDPASRKRRRYWDSSSDKQTRDCDSSAPTNRKQARH